MRSLSCLCLVFLSLFWLPASGQETGVRSHAFMVGAGSSHQLDTYLSPIQYSGYQISILRETLRQTSLFKGRGSFQSIWQGTFSQSHSRYGSQTDWGGHIGYDALWHYGWTPLPDLRLMAGWAVGADAGFLYNTSGGNNPAQGRFCIDLSASVMAIYHFRLWGIRWGLRYQARIPFMGIMFCPAFGQSYYDIGQGNWSNTVRFSYPGNAFCIWQQLTLDIPVSQRLTLRTGYLCDIRQSHVNGIRVHDRSHSFLLGVVCYFQRITGSRTQKLPVIL